MNLHLGLLAISLAPASPYPFQLLAWKRSKHRFTTSNTFKKTGRRTPLVVDTSTMISSISQLANAHQKQRYNWTYSQKIRHAVLHPSAPFGIGIHTFKVCPHRYSEEGKTVSPDTLIQHFTMLIIKEFLKWTYSVPCFPAAPTTVDVDR